MKIVVTGGAGFIGSHLVDKLIESGHDVLVLDNLSSGYISNVNSRADFIDINLGNQKSCNNLPNERFDVIYHLASHVGQELSFQNPINDIKSNAVSTSIILKWCRENNISRLIFTSSVNVYGPIKNNPVDEKTPLNPKSPYAVGKIASEHLCNIYQDFGINSTVFRFLNIYGPRQDINNLNQGMASIYMAYVKQKKPIIIKGSLERYRDFTYVTDAVDALYKCLINPISYGKTYVLSSGVKTKVSELINKILLAFGENPKKYPLVNDKSTINDQFGFFGNSQLLKKQLQWEPKIEIDEGIKKMIDWIKQNKN